MTLRTGDEVVWAEEGDGKSAFGFAKAQVDDDSLVKKRETPAGRMGEGEMIPLVLSVDIASPSDLHIEQKDSFPSFISTSVTIDGVDYFDGSITLDEFGSIQFSGDYGSAAMSTPSLTDFGWRSELMQPFHFETFLEMPEDQLYHLTALTTLQEGDVSIIPEPAALTLMLFGALVLASLHRKT